MRVEVPSILETKGVCCVVLCCVVLCGLHMILVPSVYPVTNPRHFVFFGGGGEGREGLDGLICSCRLRCVSGLHTHKEKERGALCLSVFPSHLVVSSAFVPLSCHVSFFPLTHSLTHSLTYPLTSRHVTFFHALKTHWLRRFHLQEYDPIQSHAFCLFFFLFFLCLEGGQVVTDDAESDTVGPPVLFFVCFRKSSFATTRVHGPYKR